MSDRSANCSYNHFASIRLVFIFLILFLFITLDKISHRLILEYIHFQFDRIYFHNSQLYYYGKKKKKILFLDYFIKNKLMQWWIEKEKQTLCDSKDKNILSCLKFVSQYLMIIDYVFLNGTVNIFKVYIIWRFTTLFFCCSFTFCLCQWLTHID